MLASNAVTVMLKAEPAVVELGPETEKWVAVPGLLVSENEAEVRPERLAVTPYSPGVLFAVNASLAMPLEFVEVVMVSVELLNVPLAPEPGATNSTPG